MFPLREIFSPPGVMGAKRDSYTAMTPFTVASLYQTTVTVAEGEHSRQNTVTVI